MIGLGHDSAISGVTFLKQQHAYCPKVMVFSCQKIIILNPSGSVELSAVFAS